MTTSKLARIIGPFLLLISIGQATFAKETRHWVLLGETTVNGQRDRDTIGIGKAEGRFQSIQLRVTGAPVELQRVVVHFTNGSSEDIEFHYRIPAGGQTRAIDLPGNERVINSVEFLYSKANWRGALPRVSLYAR
ncbi:MAG: hypothetical protein J2P41_13545 [Blastocatellia bacterium]|nr:hypothetical protein [Blastocatellia bacterium]